MFPFGHNPYAQAYRNYDPYEEALLQQELQRRRQVEEYHRRRQLEELNRRRAEQLEYARRQAEIERLREAEARRRYQMELEARRRKLSEPAHARTLRPRVQEPAPYEQDVRRSGGRPQSMFDAGIQDLFDALYGGRGHPSSLSPSSNGRRSKSSDPRARQPDNPPVLETVDAADRHSPTEDSAVSDTEDDDPVVSSHSVPQNPVPEVTVDAPPDADTTKAHSAISDILKSFSDLKAGFSFPSKLDFLSTPGDTTVTAPKLAYTPNNAPLHQYEHLLTGLLTKLDAVDSYGQEYIRKMRKDAVQQIERELEELDVKKLQEWRRQSEEATTTSAPVIATSEPPQEPPKEAPVGQTEVGPASIPLTPDSQEPRSNSPSQQLDSSPSPLATPLVRSPNLQPPSGNVELLRGATPTLSATDPPLASDFEKSAADVSKQPEAIEDGYVDVGRDSTGSDNTDDEASRGQLDPDDSWEAGF